MTNVFGKMTLALITPFNVENYVVETFFPKMTFVRSQSLLTNSKSKANLISLSRNSNKRPLSII